MIELKKLPTQLHVGKRPLKSRFEQPRNFGAGKQTGFMKPAGGMWTSTWETAFDIGWPGWVLSEDWRREQLDEAWLLEPKECRVIELSGFEQCHAFMLEYAEDLYPERRKMMAWPLWGGDTVDVDGFSMCPVWERVAADADAIRLLTPYDPDVRLGPYIAFNGWDCESTIWLDWCFEGRARKVDLSERIETRTLEEV